MKGTGSARGGEGWFGPLLVRLGRAVRLRCPACGGGPLLRTWFTMRPRCPRCALRTERGEQDFFLGGMMFNIVLSEGVLAVAMVALVIGLWPAVPWTLLHVGGIVLMVAMPILLYPFSKTIWMAFDLMLRPLTIEEMAWHLTSTDREFRPEADR